MNKFKKLLVLMASIVFFLSFSMPVMAKEGFDIEQYDVQIEVKEDGTYYITETLDVHFDEYLHGIYIQTPSYYEDVSWVIDGKEILKDYNFPIDHVEVLSNHDSEIDYQDKGVVTRLGSSDYYANEYETYKISYRVHSKDLDLGGIQSFYQNIISDRWDTNINHVTFKIVMPKPFDLNQLYFYTDGQDVSDALMYQVNGNVIEGSFNDVISQGRGITIKLDLPEGYFVYPTFQTPIFLIFGCSIALLLGVIYLFFKYGKDSEVVKTVEFTAPKGISSAGVGYIIDGVVDNQDVTSLIFSWANKGFITLREDKDDLEFTKVKDLDDESHYYEKTLFNGIFKSGDVVTTSQISTEIYQDFMNTKKSINDYYNTKKRKIYYDNSFVIRFLVGLLAGMPLGAYLAVAIYSYSYSIIGSLISMLVVVVLITIGCTLQNLGVQRWQSSGPSKYGLIIGGFLLVFMAGLISFGIYALLGLGFTFLYLISLVITIAICIISNFMLKRTPLGVKLYGQILGLKEFIMVAEKDRLDMLVREDPQYFFNILPYAYALGLSDVWSEHFKDLEIPAPTWYTGSAYYPYMHYGMIHSMTTHMAVVQHPIPPVSAGTGRGGDIGGGGFGGSDGGFGGGGFSGGGFGGSSGGGW